MSDGLETQPPVTTLASDQAPAATQEPLASSAPRSMTQPPIVDDIGPAPCCTKADKGVCLWCSLGVAFLLVCVAVVAAYFVYKYWPRESVISDLRILGLVALLGLLGGIVHALQSMADFVGNQKLKNSWILWYLARPPIGAILAVIIYFVMRGGLLTGFDTTVKGPPYGILAMAALTGLFSKQAVDMLAHVADVFFTTKGDEKRQDKIAKDENATTKASASGQTGTAP